MKALVSIGVPVRNGAPLIDRALRALRAQTWSNMEILVSDNGSTDATPGVLRLHASEDDRIQVERVDPTVSVAQNFDNVLQRASGEYFMWAAHDDEWAPDHVERLVRLMEEDPSVALAAAITDAVDLDGNLLRTYGRVVELQASDRLERLVGFIAQPEVEGKACLVYSLFRRADLATINLVEFYAEDARRQDYHVVLATLLFGRLRVDPELRFRKTTMPFPRRSIVQRLTDGVKYTRRAANWIASYPHVIDERTELTPEERRTIESVTRAARRWYLRNRARSVARTLLTSGGR